MAAIATFISDALGGVWIYLLGGVAIIGILWGAYHMVYSSGETACVLAQQTAQIKNDAKVQNDYAQIDQKTPTGASKSSAAKFLLQYTRTSN